MSEQPLVSIVVAFYNQAPFVRETVESILGQTYPNIEAIFSDDGSTDGTREILEEYGAGHPDRVKVVTTPENTGISGNMNRGLAHVTGKYIAIMSGDDVMLPEKIARQVELMEANPRAVMCVHDAEVFHSPGDQVLGRFSELYNGRAGVRAGGVEIAWDTTYLALPSTFMFATWALPEHGFDERLKIGNEIVWHIEIMRHGTVVAMQDELVRYRRHGSNLTINARFEPLKLEEHLMSMAILSARYPELAPGCRRRCVGYFFQGSRESWLAGKRRRAAHLAFAGVRVDGLYHGVLDGVRLLVTNWHRRRVRTSAATLAIAGPIGEPVLGEKQVLASVGER